MTFNFGARSLATALAAVALAFSAACEPAAAAHAAPIAAVHRAQCSRCHTAPQPHPQDKGYLEDAFSRHRGRVHLSEDEWAAMVDYLGTGSARLDGTGRTSPR